MLSALKNEILNKKRKLEEQKVITGNKKYYRRGELDQILYGQKPEKDTEATSSKDVISKKEAHKLNAEDMDNGPTLPRQEVIRRLREREEPILLFAENELIAFRRLRRLEILEPEMNRGLRNDFQEALERVDRAYLNDILKNAAPNNDRLTTTETPTTSTDTECTMENLQQLAKQLQTDSNTELRCKLVLQFVQVMLKLWKERLHGRADDGKSSVRGKMDSATCTQTNCYLKPLMKRLRTHSLPEDILESLTEMVLFCMERDYVKANDAYLQMAIGNAPWPIGVTMVGIHARTGREKIFSKHVAHVLNDETQRKYIQGLKRLVTKCQSYFPANPSKCVEYQALGHT